VTRLIDTPALAELRRPGDSAFVDAALDYLTAERLARFNQETDLMYQRNTWTSLARLGLFSIFGPEIHGGQDRNAFGIALMADCLANDALCSIDLAIYVQGIVAVRTLAYNPKNELAMTLLPKVMQGEAIVCTAYTDADRSRPTTADDVEDTFVINGRKSLIINAIHADYVVVTLQMGQKGANCIVDLKSPGVSLDRLIRESSTGTFVQGVISFDNVVVPKSNLLTAGIGSIWLWESVMAFSRLTNVSSILRTVGVLEECAEEVLAGRQVSGGLLSEMPAYQHWKSRVRYTQAILRANVINCILRLEAKERVGGVIAGLKARAGTVSYELSAAALDMAGGSGVLRSNPLGRIHASLRCKKFAAGGAYDLLKLYDTASFSTSLPRKRSANA